MIARHTVIRVQTLSKSEYNRSKHIPSAHPSKKPDIETEDSQEVQPTPLPVLHNITDSRINESGFRHSLLGSAEKSEIHKRSHRMRDFEMSSPGNESYLVKELQIKNEDLEETRQEIAHLRQENQKLREEREYMIRDLQQRRSASPSPQKSQRGNADYERHIGSLEEENSRLREEIGRLQLNRSGHGSPERHEFEEMRITINKVLSERDYLDTQLKQAKTIQISLEQELRQKTDERNKLFSDYEVKIATLQHEIAGYKSQKQGDNLRQSQMLGSLQHENSELTNEVNRLRQQKIDMETMLETLRRDKLSVDNNLGLRLAELEAANTSNISILDQERRSSQSLRLMLQQREKDLATKETEITNLLQQKIQLEANKTTSINPAIVLYMAEIERLQALVNERTVEIETHKLRQSQEIESVKILSESRLKDSMKLEMLQVNSQLQAERNQTQLELANLRKTIMDYETKIVFLTDELDKANKRGGFELSSPSYLKPQGERDMFWDDSRRKSEAEKRSGYGMLDVDDLLRSPVERALRSPVVDHGGDRVALENQILTLRLSVEDYEKKQAQMTVELSELQRKVQYLEEEKLRYQIELQAERDRSRGETDRHMFEVQISGYKSRVEDLENKVRVLKTENEGLQQTNSNQGKELSEWRVRFEMVREDVIRESSSERHLLENQLKEMIHHNEELENKIVLIGSELSRLEQLSEALRIERNQWQSKYEEASQHILILKADMDTQNKDAVEEELHRLTTQFGKDKESFERQLQDTQQKNYMLVEEVERLHIVLAEKDRDIHALAEEREHVERDAEEKVEEMQRKYDDMLQDKLDSEVKEKSGQWLTEKRTLETELKGVTQRYRDLESEMETLHNENIRLHDKLNAANAQLDQQNKNLDQLQLKNTLYIQELKSEVSVQLTTEFEQKIRELTERFGTERSGLDEQIRRLKGRILELEVLVQDKDREVNRLADDAMSHAHEVDTLKNRYEELEKNSVNSLQDLTHKMEQQRNQDIEEVVKKTGNQHQFEKNSLESALMRAQEKVRSLENKVAELCVEHERVVEERNKLAMELDDQREAVNRTSTQYFSEKSTYETRFNALTVKVQEYEKQISTLNDEVNNLKRVNAMQTSEIEGMKSTTQNSASQWTIEKTSLEGQKKSLSEQIESLNRKIVMLNGEVERLTTVNSKQVIELEEYRRKIESQERDSQNAMEQLRWQLESKYRKEREEFEVSTRQNYDQYKGEYDVNLRKVQRENTELDKRVRLAEAETERLELQLRSKNDEVRDVRERISVVENLKNQEIQRLRDVFEAEKRDIENAVFNEKLEAERGHLNAKIKELKQKINDLENRNTYVTVELEKHNSMYRSKAKEVETWQEKYNKLESSRFVEIDQVKSQVEILKRSSLQISDYEVRFKAERSAYEAQILQYKQAMEELESRVKDLASENERINTLYLERKRELDGLRGQQGKMDVGFHKEVDSLRRENETLKREKFDFNALKVKFEVERKAYENEIAQLQHAMSTKKIEIAKLYDLIDTRRVESENLAQELLEAREEIAKNLKYCKELEGEYLELNSKYDQVMKEAGDLQRSKELYRSQIDQSQRELAKRNRELIHRIHEVDSIKSRYEEAYSTVEPMGTMTSKVITRLSGMDHSKLG